MSQWQETIEYLNDRVGKKVTLIDMEVDLNHIRAPVLCSYRGTLIKSGYIKRIDIREYKTIKKIPIDLGYIDAKYRSKNGKPIRNND